MANLSSESWYIVKQPSEHCKIISAQSFLSTQEKTTEEKTADSKTDSTTADSKEADSKRPNSDSQLENWGPFDTQHQAIAKRVGLIRAGKCKPS